MIKLICCDLDQTMVFTGNIHFESLNKALSEVAQSFVISLESHLAHYNGLPSKKKLEILKLKGLPEELIPHILNKKQAYTEFFVRKLISRDDYKQQRECLEKLKADGYILACCSNAIKSSVYTMLECSVGTDLFDTILSAEDTISPKPNPEIYKLAMALNLINDSKECLIIEDSEFGVRSATDSGAHVLVVKDPSEFNYKLIKDRIEEIEKQL